MSEYDMVKKGKITFKGDKTSSKRKRKHKQKDKNKDVEPVEDEDKIRHGGWSNINSTRLITGSVAIEFGNQTYVTALDNGLFTLGPPHNEGEGPLPEEVLTAVNVSETKVAFKSGYGKYLGVHKDGTVIGRSDAIGALEQWEPVFQDGKLALLSCTNCFMSIRPEDDHLVASSKTAGSAEFVQIRTTADMQTDDVNEVPVEEKGSLSQIEENYVRKFQKFQDKKLKMNSGDKSDLKKAKKGGVLHEAMLDRRSKMKADRYCK
uniref:Protein FRG1 homolog n=1 Tax=Graphocephala atropunctata TaxID=36148 RepID=A0A1B6LVN5_9HEMI